MQHTHFFLANTLSHLCFLTQMPTLVMKTPGYSTLSLFKSYILISHVTVLRKSTYVAHTYSWLLNNKKTLEYLFFCFLFLFFFCIEKKNKTDIPPNLSSSYIISNSKFNICLFLTSFQNFASRDFQD